MPEKHKLIIRRHETWEAEVEIEAESREAAILATDALLQEKGWDAVVDGEGEYAECWAEVVDDTEADDVGLTAADREAASAATGYGPDDMSDDRIAAYLLAHADESIADMELALSAVVAIFEAHGGRGVEVADEIDGLRVAIAIHKARHPQ